LKASCTPYSPKVSLDDNEPSIPSPFDTPPGTLGVYVTSSLEKENSDKSDTCLDSSPSHASQFSEGEGDTMENDLVAGLTAKHVYEGHHLNGGISCLYADGGRDVAAVLVKSGTL